MVFRDVNQVTVLPEGEEAQPIISAKTTFRWDISESVAAVGEVYYTYDTNRVTFRDDLTGVAQPSFVDPARRGLQHPAAGALLEAPHRPPLPL